MIMSILDVLVQFKMTIKRRKHNLGQAYSMKQ